MIIIKMFESSLLLEATCVSSLALLFLGRTFVVVDCGGGGWISEEGPRFVGAWE